MAKVDNQPTNIINDATKAIKIFENYTPGDIRDATSEELDVHDPKFLITMIKILLRELKKTQKPPGE